MATTNLVILKLAEERYALDSAAAYGNAEDEAKQTGTYPAVYPEPFNTIGCGFGRLSDHVRKHCDVVARELGLEADYCHQTDLLITVHCGTEDALARYRRTLGEHLEAVRAWIVNDSELWPPANGTRQPHS